ncbi:MAG TPA: hypothetical protein DDZ89_00215, partial [Clostridiales bacterium]|nr:hypothetical protein [Clostridiales bacterium]
MSGLENIIKRIKEDADSMQAQLETQTKSSMDQIMDSARLELEEKRQYMLKQAQTAGQLKQERMV